MQAASLSKQIQNVRQTITNVGTVIATEKTNADLSAEQRLVKLETTHQNILQMLDDLKRRVEQLEVNKQAISAVRFV